MLSYKRWKENFRKTITVSLFTDLELGADGLRLVAHVQDGNFT